ncbi:MAG: aldose epimerase family protein [Bacteroidota bacterium]
MEIHENFFGTTKHGETVFQYFLENDFKTRIGILNFGCIIQSIETLDKYGQMGDIVLGFDTLEEYENDTHYIGAIVGRVANRIGNAKYKDEDEIVELDQNEGKNHLHGGRKGLNKKVWGAKPFKKNDSVGIDFSFLSPDGENGYPGNVDLKVRYLLNNKNQLMIYFSAKTDKRTPINLCSHAYYNLSALKSKTILSHYVMINALKYLETNAELIPTGTINYVLGTPLNFSRGKVIGEEIKKTKNGYDHSYIINKEANKFGITTKVVDPESGRIIEIVTDQPNLQFYTSNYFDGNQLGKKGHFYVKHAAFCLETQGFPDAPNHPNFPSVFINPNEKYSSHTQITFEVKHD